MKLNLKKILVFTIINIGITSFAFAGMGSQGGGGAPCGGLFPPCPIPLDGGISLLLIAGAAYGGKKIYNTFNKNPE